MLDLTDISDEIWTQMSIFAEHNELTLDYVLSEFFIDNTFTPVN